MNKQLYYILIGCSLLFAGCNKASIIEGVGPVNGGGSTTANRQGTITVYASGVWRCGSISVYVDGELKGTISQDSYSDPRCGASSSSSVLTIKLPAGQHVIRGRGRTCSWSERTVDISSGSCLQYELEG